MKFCITLEMLRLTKKGRKHHEKKLSKNKTQGFPGGAVVKNLPADAGDKGSIPGPGRSHMPQSN